MNIDALLMQVVGGLTVISISATGGYIIHGIRNGKRLFPWPKQVGREEYAFLSGTWNEFHYTHDRANKPAVFLSHSTVTLSLSHDLALTGESQYSQQNSDKMSLRMRIRGEVREGRCYFVGVCIQNPSDVFSVIINNLLSEDTLLGVHSGIDWRLRPYAAPVLLSKKPLSESKAAEKLRTAGVAFYTDGREL